MDTKTLTQTIDKAASAAKKLVGKLEHKGDEAKAAVDETVERVQSQVVQGAKKGEHRLGETVERAAHRVQETAHKLANRAEEIADKLSNHAKRAVGAPGRPDSEPHEGAQAPSGPAAESRGPEGVTPG